MRPPQSCLVKTQCQRITEVFEGSCAQEVSEQSGAGREH